MVDRAQQQQFFIALKKATVWDIPTIVNIKCYFLCFSSRSNDKNCGNKGIHT